jgi:hypothetical protein
MAAEHSADGPDDAEGDALGLGLVDVAQAEFCASRSVVFWVMSASTVFCAASTALWPASICCCAATTAACALSIWATSALRLVLDD